MVRIRLVDRLFCTAGMSTAAGGIIGRCAAAMSSALRTAVRRLKNAFCRGDCRIYGNEMTTNSLVTLFSYLVNLLLLFKAAGSYTYHTLQDNGTQLFATQCVCDSYRFHRNQRLFNCKILTVYSL
jgi:hypothetical protein